jgi:hypothetical protein
MAGKRTDLRRTPEEQAAYDERTRFIQDVISRIGEPRPRRRRRFRFLRRA